LVASAVASSVPEGRAGPQPAEATLVPPEERKRIEDLEQRVVSTTETRASGSARDLELLADLYFQVDHYEPALETLEALLAHPNAARLSDARRAALSLKQSTILRRQGRFAEAWDRLSPSVSEATLPRALKASCAIEGAMLLCHLARYDEALDLARAAVQHAELESDKPLLAKAVGQVGFVHLRRGDMLLARESYEEALPQFRRLGDETQVAWVRNNLGIVCKNLCEWDAARAHFNDAIAIHRRLGQHALLGNRLQNLGVLLVKSGAWERAHVVLEEARQCFAQVGDRWGVVINLLARGWLARLEGRLDESEKLLTEALDKSLAEGFLREEALSREFLGDVAFDRGQVDRAAESYRAALSLGERQAPAGDLVSEVLRRIAEVEIVRGRLDAANAAIERASYVCQLLDDRYETAVLQRVKGQLAAAQGRRDEAAQFLRAAVNLFGEMGERFERGKSLTLLARIVTEPGEPKRLLYRARACFAEIGADRQLAEVERELAAGDPAQAPVLTTRHASEGRLKGRKIANPDLVGPSRAMARVADLVSRAAGTDLSVILIGETGTGKELVARGIHTQSRRADRPFVAVNCGALRPELALSQLFGHRRGAFTGAHADGVGFVEAAHTGTLFLDEIGELPTDVQVTLLRFLESGEYLRLGETQVRKADVRIVGATHVDLRRAVAEKSFRADLFYRLHEVEIALPALRERTEDILPLARHFLRAYGGDASPGIGEDAANVLLSHAWPGNVRELENCVKRALALLPRTLDQLPAEGLAGMFERSPMAAAPTPVFDYDAEPSRASLKAQVAEADRRELVRALDESQGNKSRAAERLGVSRKTLYARMRRLGLEVDDPA
jgi:DNA-binding NtrC family response regulator/tetratricopeptide (TPR) repeat protein